MRVGLRPAYAVIHYCTLDIGRLVSLAVVWVVAGTGRTAVEEVVISHQPHDERTFKRVSRRSSGRVSIFHPSFHTR